MIQHVLLINMYHCNTCICHCYTLIFTNLTTKDSCFTYDLIIDHKLECHKPQGH